MPRLADRSSPSTCAIVYLVVDYFSQATDSLPMFERSSRAAFAGLVLCGQFEEMKLVVKRDNTRRDREERQFLPLL